MDVGLDLGIRPRPHASLLRSCSLSGLQQLFHAPTSPDCIGSARWFRPLVVVLPRLPSWPFPTISSPFLTLRQPYALSLSLSQCSLCYSLWALSTHTLPRHSTHCKGSLPTLLYKGSLPTLLYKGSCPTDFATPARRRRRSFFLEGRGV